MYNNYQFAELIVPRHIYDEMERVVALPTGDVKKGGVEFDEEVTFKNGVRMAIQVCGPSDPKEESCWTQGVLFSSDGVELGFTDVSDEFGGQYAVEDDDTLYSVNVVCSDTATEITYRLLST